MATRRTSTKKKVTKRPARPKREDAPRHPPRPLSGPEAKRQLERVRAICLALPDATEKIAWGGPTFRCPKVFAMFDDHHHGDGRIALWCPAPSGAQVVLVSSEPKRFFVPPYVGKAGWIGINLAAIGDARLRELVREAYSLLAPEKQRAKLGE